MKNGFILVVCLAMSFVLFCRPANSEIRTVVGATLFGGAERGTEGNAGGVGGIEGFGIFPVGGNFGFQGSMRHEGGNAGSGGYRLGLSAGPVYGYASGKVGLNVDYQFMDATDSNFIFLRGVWAHYFDKFDLVLSYSQPVHEVQRGDRNLIRTRDPG
jgi:hypothetical protein